jgi:hypothetical protein
MTQSSGNTQSFPLVLLALVGSASNVCMVTNRPAGALNSQISDATMPPGQMWSLKTAELIARTNAGTMPSVIPAYVGLLGTGEC